MNIIIKNTPLSFLQQTVLNTNLRQNQVVPGANKENLQETRRQKNIVTFWYNMTIWLAEGLSVGVIVRQQQMR